jgi:uncharacterized protein YkwD
MRTRAKGPSRARLQILLLEDRTVPAVVASLINGQLTVCGDGAANAISLSYLNGQYSVAGQNFAAASVQRIVIDAGDGNDTVTVAPSVTAPTTIFGGNGNDTIYAGGGNTEVYGGMGSDTIHAGTGQDTIYGGGGGTDTILGAKPGDTTSAGAPVRTGQLGTMEQQILALVNQQRAANGLPPLTVSPQLTYAAQLQSTNMAAMSSVVGDAAAMSHSLDGSPEPNLTDRADYAGYQYSVLGENIAYGYSGAASVMNAWMNSPGHRANILQSMFTQIGISVHANAQGTLYFTEEFGAPAPGATNAGGTGQTPIAAPAPVAPPLTTSVTPTGGSTVQAAPNLTAVGTKGGTVARVVAYDAATGRQVFSVQPFGGFTGGVHVATGDVNGDGYDDLVVAAGTGGGPIVRVFDGKTGNLIRDFYAYTPSFTGGVNVAVGDINGDGMGDIITGAGPGGGPHVQVFSGADNHVIDSFFAYVGGFHGGVNVAAGDVNGDGRADIVTGAGQGGGPHVEAFDGRSLQEFRSFFAYDPDFTGGVNVAVGDTNGDGMADIITGAEAGGGPHVKVFSGASNQVLDSFFAFSGGFTGGVSVATANVNGSTDLVVGGGAGKTPDVKTIQCGTMSLVRDVTAFDPSFLGGVFVG